MSEFDINLKIIRENILLIIRIGKRQLPWRRSIDLITDSNLNGERMYSAKKKFKSQTEKRKVKKIFSDWKILSQPEKRKRYQKKNNRKKKIWGEGQREKSS
jgi:hypothetical protein